MPESNAKPAQRARRWKRTVAAALLLLIGGAIVNVAVAWGCVLAFPPIHGYGFIPGKNVALTEEVVTDVLSQSFPQLSSKPEITLWGHRQTRFGWGTSWAVAYVPLDALDGFPEALGFQLTESSSGWPLRSMVGQIEWEDDLSRCRAAVKVPSWMKGAGHREAIEFFPLKPLLPGFTINTLFYALLIWLLFLAPFAARRVLRRKRRLCEKCAYPIGTSPVCTECGAAVPRKPRA